MHLSDYQMEISLIEASKWLNPLVYLVGSAITFRAFRRCGKKGYLVVTFYFAVMIFITAVVPYLNHAINELRKPDISAETRRRAEEASREATVKIFGKNGQYVPIERKTFHLPVAPVLLVLGLWLLARTETSVDEIPAQPQK